MSNNDFDDWMEGIAKDKQFINGYQSSPDYLKLIKYPDNMTCEAMCIALSEIEEDNGILPDIANSHYPIPNTLYEFKHLKGISSTQKIVKQLNNHKYTKLSNGYIERKICTIHNLSYDAITNIQIRLVPELSFHDAAVISMVMKINDGTASIKEETLDENVYTVECKFIKFPNIIVNIFKNGPHPKIDLYIHHKKGIDMNVICTTKYDAIILAPVSRKAFIESCKHYMFNTASGLICMVSMGLYGYKYTTQLKNALSDNIRPLYFPETTLFTATIDNNTEIDNKDDMSIVI